MPLPQVDLTPTVWLILVLLGGAVGADRSSFPQVMISRPLVAATAAGAVFGEATAGFLAGAVLELLTLPHMPLGAARTPDEGIAGLLAGAAYGATGGLGIGSLAAAAAVGWLGGWVGGWTSWCLKEWNAVRFGELEALSGRPDRIETRHRWAVRVDFLRGGAVTAGLLVPAVVVTGLAAAADSSGGETAAAAAVVAAVAAAAGAAVRVMAGARAGAAWGGAGAVVAVVAFALF